MPNFFCAVNFGISSPMHQLIHDSRPQIEALCRQFNVSRLEVFGSAARAVDFDLERSDADFLVEFFRPSKLGKLEEYLELRSGLSELLARPVDLVSFQAVKNPYVRRTIEQNRELIYAA